MMLRRSWLGSYEKYCDKRKVPLDGKKHSSYTRTHATFKCRRITARRETGGGTTALLKSSAKTAVKNLASSKTQK